MAKKTTQVPQRINVTKPFMPDFEAYTSTLKKAWDLAWLTNRGILVQSLEEKLREYLGVEYITCTTNGTLPIQIAIKALGLSGEIITTPFSYVATTSCIVWENCQPVFVDIEEGLLTIDPDKIEAAITDKTTAILATHVFGNPCDVHRIQAIADRHGLKVIYDAAHCFGVEYDGQSIFNYGDVSTCSFHATKIFHTGEGGCWITNDKELHEKLFYHHNFGHDGPEAFHGIGINAKMSELQAAMGLAMFEYLEDIIQQRQEKIEFYQQGLDQAKFSFLELRPGTKWNYHYFPIMFSSEGELLRKLQALNDANIYPRRYFYPSLNELPYVDRVSCPISEQVSASILCLPLYPDLPRTDQERIIAILND